MSALFVMMFVLWSKKLTSSVCVRYSGPSIPVPFISLGAFLAALYGQEININGINASDCPTALTHYELKMQLTNIYL
jgi:hypothetical protein